MENHGLVMDTRIELIMHMAVGLMVGISQMEMTRSKVESSWRHSIGEVMDMGSTLDFV